MGSRKNPRKKMVLPLRVTGTDATGNLVVHLAHTLDISTTGVRLGGLRGDIAAGDMVSLQYRAHKSQFRVVWVGRPGTSSADQIGIECLDADKKILGLEIPWEAVIDDYEREEDPHVKYRKHRSHMRFPVNGGADVRTTEGRKGTWGRLADLSSGGCYIQTTTPLLVHTRTRVLLKVGRTELEMWGAVRTCHPDVGMGIQFTEPVTPTDGDRLAFLMKQLVAGEGASSPVATKLDPAHIAQRLQTASVELMSIEDLVNSYSPEAVVLRPLRETLSHVRSTSWAVQKWLELENQKQDLFPVISQLNNDRLRTAAQLCRGLTKEIQLPDFAFDRSELDDLLRAVEELFSQLAGFDLVEIEPASAEPRPVAAAEEAGLQTVAVRGVQSEKMVVAAQVSAGAASRLPVAQSREVLVSREDVLPSTLGPNHSPQFSVAEEVLLPPAHREHAPSEAIPEAPLPLRVTDGVTQPRSHKKKAGEKKRRGSSKKSAV